MDKTLTLTLTKTAIVNLTVNYANQLLDLGESETTEDFAYATGFCAAAELWMNALGISPKSNFVEDIINRCNKLRKGE